MKVDTPYPIDVIRELENKYPVTAKTFKALQHDNYELFAAKQIAYGPNNIAMGTSLETDADKRLALMGLAIRINDKCQRLINLVVHNNKNTLMDESVIDTFTDLSNYGLIAQIINEGNSWGK